MKKMNFYSMLLMSLVAQPIHIWSDNTTAVVPSPSAPAAANKFSDSKYALCKIGFVNMGMISSKSIFMQKINDTLNKKQADLKVKIDAFQKYVTEESKKVQATLSSLSPQKQQQKREELNKKIRDKETVLQSEQAKIEQFQRSMMMEIIRQLRLILAKLGEKYGCQVIVDSESLLYYNKEHCFDLTEESILLLNSVTEQNGHSESLDTASAAA
jgi:Skp family chaperone for outer membrane proteins